MLKKITSYFSFTFAVMRINIPFIDKILWNKEYKNGKWDYIDKCIPDNVITLVKKHLQEGSLLDLGCGTGSLCESLIQYKKYTGVDLSEIAINTGRNRYRKKENTDFVISTILDFNSEQTYDVILLAEVIYYIPMRKWEDLINKYRKNLSENGVFIVTIWDTTDFIFPKHLITNWNITEIVTNDKAVYYVFN